jgi:hypothetical protein
MAAPRVLIAIGPSIYAEALAFSVSKHRPRAEVSLLDPSEDIEAEVRHARPHLIVANRVPPAARAGTCFWVEVAEPTGGEGAKALEAKISADGYSPGWRHSWRLDDRPRHHRAQGGREKIAEAERGTAPSSSGYPPSSTSRNPAIPAARPTLVPNTRPSSVTLRKSA